MRRLWLVLCASCTSEASVGSNDAGVPLPEAGADVTVIEDASVVDTYVPDVDPSGAYALLLRSGKNGCALPLWNEGSVSPVTVTITRAEAGAGYDCSVTNVAAVSFGLVVGTNVMRGDVKGRGLDFRVEGTLQQTIDACTFTYDVAFEGALEGERMTGDVTFTRKLTPQCAMYACASASTVAGWRDTTIDP